MIRAFQPPGQGDADPGPAGLRLAELALVVGLLYAAISVYWGLGGTWLLSTVGGALEKQGRAGNAGVLFVVWAAVALKVIAAVLPLVALRRQISPAWDRAIWGLAWIEAAILIIYGLVLTVAGLLVQAGVIHPSATADHRALAWHLPGTPISGIPGFSSGGFSSPAPYCAGDAVTGQPPAADQPANQTRTGEDGVGIAGEFSAPVTSDLTWIQPTSLTSTACRSWTGHASRPSSMLAFPRRRAPAARTVTRAG